MRGEPSIVVTIPVGEAKYILYADIEDDDGRYAEVNGVIACKDIDCDDDSAMCMESCEACTWGDHETLVRLVDELTPVLAAALKDASAILRGDG